MTDSGPPADSSLAGSPHSQHRVLIVEDHPDVGWLMKNLVTHCGYQAHWAASSSEALTAMDGFKPQIVLLDIGLPGISGYELAEQLAASSPGNRPIFVALTGHSDEDHRRQSLQAGFAFHLVKPVNLATLAQVLQQCLNSRTQLPMQQKDR